MVERKNELDTRASLLLLGCCLFWGLQQVLIKVTLAEVPPVWQAALRFMLATLARSPGSRTIFLMVIRPSKTSGTSISNSFSRKRGEVRDRMMLGVPFTISTRSTTARTESPFLKKSAEICSAFGRMSSLPSSSITSISFFQTW